MTNQPPEKWTLKSKGNVLSTYRSNIGNMCEIDNSLIEQLQSEAVEKYKNGITFTQETMEFIKLVKVDERLMTKFVEHIEEEARADERKKCLKYAEYSRFTSPQSEWLTYDEWLLEQPIEDKTNG